MIRIGEFAKIFDVSIKTIRFYEEKGLIYPEYVDVYTGYRYYGKKNIKEMTKILFLKGLNFSIKEIKIFDEKSIDSKIREYENKIQTIYKNINTLKNLSGRGENAMKTFINDENVIGKWELVGLVKEKDDYSQEKYLEDSEYRINELYLMDEGQEYWVISWTKGFINIKDNSCPYEIENNLMFLKVIDQIDHSNYIYAVYRKIDSKHYKIADIEHHDNINIEFVQDEKLIGFWKTVDYINNKNMFNPNKKHWQGTQYIEKINVSRENDIIVSTSDGGLINISYSKGYLINFLANNTLSKYEYETIDGKLYLIVEWKSGDYVYGKMVNGYYVLEKIG